MSVINVNADNTFASIEDSGIINTITTLLSPNAAVTGPAKFIQEGFLVILGNFWATYCLRGAGITFTENLVIGKKTNPMIRVNDQTFDVSTLNKVQPVALDINETRGGLE